MEFRDFGDRRLQLPSVERDDLTDERPTLRGEIDLAEAHVQYGEHAAHTGEGSITKSVLSGLNLSETVYAPLELSDVVIEDAELSNAVWRKTTARRVRFARCRAIGWQLQLDKATDVLVEYCRLDYGSLRLDRVANVMVFYRCTFRETAITGDLSRVVFADCDLAGAEFDAAQATGCDLRGSQLAGAQGLLTLSGATISTEQAVSVAVQLATECGLRVED
ncbi:pentapeptide repeat-containing protein [Amycolatopsis acidiphila]|uniref:Pentapeptide repeat-containing protein n=1 Tax=Amycolatopsis acidiphila TaxID=715473 RepID=A0A558A900_9PSEU|nr:pentapeptide repeat-containing protein [Amycolatopsis acidiphila]TVT20716.1 pentapeptide repeat-containing protein [Amycolatopsis acidiphila]UIJ59018.1 pentapeptide repeat-containing protein [Amycolatopsis acidiphila]GHG73376.1 hypothetical protein GCM10017788_36670 [Amycolatopsis acidiphila]